MKNRKDSNDKLKQKRKSTETTNLLAKNKDDTIILEKSMNDTSYINSEPQEVVLDKNKIQNPPTEINYICTWLSASLSNFS